MAIVVEVREIHCTAHMVTCPQNNECKHALFSKKMNSYSCLCGAHLVCECSLSAAVNDLNIVTHLYMWCISHSIRPPGDKLERVSWPPVPPG